MAERDDDEEASESAQPAGAGGKKKLIIIIGAAVVVLLGAGAGLYFSGLLDSLLGGKKETAETSAPAAGDADSKSGKDSSKDSGPVGPVAFFDVPEMVITLNTSPRSKAAFMKIHVVLELAGANDIPKVQLALPRIVDNLQPYLRELRVEELKGSPGAYRLKEEMLTRVRAAVTSARVNAVLLKDLQIQ